MVLGSKQKRKRVNWGQNFHENLSVQNYTKCRDENKAPTSSMKINFVVENVGGLGVKLTKKEGKLEAKFESTFMCQESYQKQGLVQSDNI